MSSPWNVGSALECRIQGEGLPLVLTQKTLFPLLSPGDGAGASAVGDLGQFPRSEGPLWGPLASTADRSPSHLLSLIFCFVLEGECLAEG